MMLAGAFSVHAGTQEYVFKPSLIQNTTEDPFPNSDWGGKLFLDSSSSTNGMLSDVNQSESSVTTPYGTFYLADGSFVTSKPPFTWTPAGITSMDIYGEGPLNVNGSLDVWQIEASYIYIALPDPKEPQVAGVWVPFTAVPDSASTALLIGLAAAGLAGFGHFSRKRQLAMARR